MNSFAEKKKSILNKINDKPSLSSITSVESFLNLDDSDSTLPLLFEQFPTFTNLIEDDSHSFLKEFDSHNFNQSNEDQNSYCTFTTVQSLDQDLILTDFEKMTCSSPHSLFLRKDFGIFSPSSNDKWFPNAHAPLSIEQFLESTTNTCCDPSCISTNINGRNVAEPDMVLKIFKSSDAQKKHARLKTSASDNDHLSVITPQKETSFINSRIKHPHKVQKCRQSINSSNLNNKAQRYNMVLNDVFDSGITNDISIQNQVTGGSYLEPVKVTGIVRQMKDEIFSNDSQISGAFRPSPGRPRKERRPTFLKKDANVTLEEKLTYYHNVLNEAKKNNLPGIFLREQAVSEFCDETFGNTATYLKLVLSNFDAVQDLLDQNLLSLQESCRTIWRIKRLQEDNVVIFDFSLSDELSTVPDNEMEISVFTLVVPGHTTKHLITSSQYLEMVNFMLGRHYNHAINDNLAEATVGSDGKMIPTQKHHASRVRSHVKKYLKRHVIKDKRRYTEDDRRDVREFAYKTALHNIVMESSIKKPFESKVSIALMEVHHARDALAKQAEFFIFKKLS